MREAAKKWPTSAEEFDRMFDDGEDIDHLIDWSSAERVNRPTPVGLELPLWMVKRLDAHAVRRNVSRQALINMWLAERLEKSSLA